MEKVIVEYNNYSINTKGEVKNIKTGKILKPGKVSGYSIVGLCKNGKSKTFYIHQLVSIYFLGHIQNGYEQVINHINGDKLDNRIENLEIVSNRYNSSCYRKNLGSIWVKKNKNWKSSIYFKGSNIHLGNYNTKEEAQEYYKKALKLIESGIATIQSIKNLKYK